MFTPQERDQLRSDLLDRAARDGRISGGAITGSAVEGREDRWSDVDLTFGVSADASLAEVLSDWTAHMYERHLAVHHLDMIFGAWTYRVFLLSNTLQVDLAFVTDTEFRALGPAFRLMFGKAQEPRHASAAAPESIIGLAWLHALHARSCIARGKFWQAEYMISGLRDNALALACIRHGLSAVHGRGLDSLPGEVTSNFQSTLVRQLDAEELWRAFQAVVQALVGEIRSIDQELAERLATVLVALCEPTGQ